jgi:hypothetical protein
MAMDDYRARRTLFEQESTFRVDAGTLTRSVGGADVQHLALADVRKVRLAYQPLTMVDRWVCSVEGGGARIWVPSASFLGPARAEDRRATFRPFVEALSQAIAAQPGASEVSFAKGSNWSAYGALALLIVLVVMLVLLALGVMGAFIDGQGVGGASWVFLPTLVVLMSVRMVWRVWRRNRRAPFDPNAFPADFAPTA